MNTLMPTPDWLYRHYAEVVIPAYCPEAQPSCRHSRPMCDACRRERAKPPSPNNRAETRAA